MDNSSIIISIVIVLCIAAGVTAYGLTNDTNTVFNDLSGFTPDAQGNTGIGNNSTNGTGNSTDVNTNTSSLGTSSSSSSSTSSSSKSSTSSSSSSKSKHNVSPEKAKAIAENAWPGATCYKVTYDSHGYYVCLLKDSKGNTGYCYVGSGTGKILEGALSNEASGSSDSDPSSEN